MEDIRYNGIGFNADYLKTVSMKQFIERHIHLWPEKPQEQVEKDLRTVWQKVNGSKGGGSDYLPTIAER